MLTQDFNQLSEELWESCRKTMFDTKGIDYASVTDRLANFKDQAAQYGMEPMQIWLVYAGKHWDAIVRSVVANPSHPTKKGEPLSENFKDIICYACLGHALITEQSKQLNVATALDLKK